MTTFTEPAKTDVTYTESQISEMTWFMLGETTWATLAEQTWSTFKGKISAPTITEPVKTTTVFTEPSK